jgi:iron(III) transport system ATP-binding protein
MTSHLQIDNLKVSYDDFLVVDGIDLDLTSGTIGCILGPSGCGKTTVLRTIAGFEMPMQGEVRVDGEIFSNAGYQLAPEKRNVGMVFQDFALFPNLNITENIGFGLYRWENKARTARVHELLAMIGLPAYGQAFPHQISGGQQQRVALARALAPGPSILLMDEPFSNMDVDLREQLTREVRDILKQENITAVLVTHDQHEAFAIADDIYVMNEGKIQQRDSGYNLYHKPANRFVADFIGQGVILPATVISSNRIRTELGDIEGDESISSPTGSHVDVLIRPDDIVHDDDSDETAVVVDKAFRGSDFLYFLRMDSGVEVLCLAPSHHNHHINERIGIKLNAHHLVTFPRTEGSIHNAR